ncbi:MAG: sugar phosphate isomerase/epimerase [Prevotella sp.]|nr:sugar phosphate isomerase/epimerase [Prevotella sp.]
MKKIMFFALAMLMIGQVAMAQQGNRRGTRRMAPVKKEMGLQLYSIRELIGSEESYAKNHVEVFRQLRDMGYTYVEAAHYNDGKFYGVAPEQYKKDCEAAGLKPISSHTTRGLNDEELANHDFKEALKWWAKAIKAHKAAGMEYIVTPGWGVPKTLKDAQTMCDYANEIGKMCREAGLKYGYHTHSHEYQKVEDQVWMDYFIEHTDPANMFWQMDVYWACWGNQFPVHYFKKYPGRFKMLHIKDKYELGESGFVGFDAIFGAADTAGLENFIVEIEETDGTIDIMEACRRSAEYIQRNRFVRPSYAK